LLKAFAQLSISDGKLVVGLGQTFRLQGMEDLSVVDSRDEPIGDGTDGFIEVRLSGKGVKSSLGREQWILGSDGGLNWVEGNGEQWRVWWGLVWQLIGSIGRVIGHGSGWE
jgi:hypothetical protein